jgi:murein L,D-transpeptidase YafK
MRISRRAAFVLCGFAVSQALAIGSKETSASAVVAAANADAQAGVSPEHQLQIAVQAIDNGRDNDALKELFNLTQREPNFRLAQLLYAQLLAMRSGIADALPMSKADSAQLKELREEFRVRVGHSEREPTAGSLPSDIVELANSEPYVLLADLSRSRLYVLSNRGGRLQVVEDFYSTLARRGFGKRSSGDLMTPVGIYRATTFTPGSALPAFYGAGAFPLNYPNAWDRVHGRTGYGIWLHGVPADTYSRPPRASEGCLVLANEDLLRLKQIIHIDETPVIFSDHVDWVPPERQAARRAEIKSRIEAWREAWAKHDSAEYQSFYARDFRGNDGSSKPHFDDAKLLAKTTTPLDIHLTGLNLFAYPGQQDLMLAQFTQDYSIDNVSHISRREQYWQRQSNGRWKIAHEENH